ncbi:MAG: bifunctional (p)ppGpp synthetase/guanosine-3',5'-bis(diphosphate) 3'-pyrophosphohydrolase [Coriobacteriia bacterium]|nr:bifunctional (p)ppGpp synthetase/guanosine-3',5'-bis(diphosphate) 3'-pyrophosphohydrolase [Coriobacteriia bacterium]
MQVTATLEQIKSRIQEYNPGADLGGLMQAYEFAAEAHERQTRKSGEPFVNHPLEVTAILAGLHLDTATLMASLLHDVVEDSCHSLDEIRELFGDEVAGLVDGVTKLGKVKFESLSEQQSNNLRKMLIAMAQDIRVILIKLADRLHNMRTLAALPDHKRVEKARETIEIYVPLAHRLGISQVKWELEDLAFFYLEPVKFHQVSRMVAESRDARESYTDEVLGQLHEELGIVGICTEISGRPKHLYSIYQKMSGQGKDFSEIYDLIALRIIVDSVKDCYGALGTVHSIYKPVPGRFKDYVAMPKFNMYQSLHTTVIGPSGRPLEIQIRTEEMHRTAEYGIAAHWRYKEGYRGDESFDERLSWLRQMLEWQTELRDPREFMEALKIDLFDEEVFVFTPKGDVISLRRGSTPIDFAYAIHTEVGNRCVGAKVNGSIVPLAYELQMGDRIDVLTNKNANPSRDWLNIVRTSSAKSKIRSFFSKASRVDDLQRGRDELVKVMRKHGIHIGNKPAEKALNLVATDMSYAKGEDLLAQIGAGKLSAKMVGTKLLKCMSKDGEDPGQQAHEPTMPLPLTQPMEPPQSARKRTDAGVTVQGIDDVLVRLARCCSPVPGDEIIGFVTRGRGVSVHRRTCPNTKDLTSSPERLIHVQWDSGSKATYQVEIYIEAIDRLRLLQDVTAAVAESGVNILSSATITHRDGIVEMRFLFEIGEMRRLDVLLRDTRQVEGVFDARRMLPGEGTQKKARR